MRQKLTALVAALCLLLVVPAATQAGMASKIKSKAKSSASKVGQTAHKAADKTGDTAKKGAEAAKKADAQAKPMVQQLGTVFEGITK